MMDGPEASSPVLNPMQAYRARIAAGQLAPDSDQALAAERLQSLWNRLRGYTQAVPVPDRSGLFGRLLKKKASDDIPPDYPHGLYLVGDVGRGKSMLMDMFFDTVPLPRKRRIHFHQFMQEAHSRIHAWRRGPERLADPHNDDPIPPLATQIAGEAALLCFDEFQVTNIADAMILGRLFKALFARGVVVVATSNTAPKDLFAGQPGRDAFLPFIGLIETYLDLIVMGGERDYRRKRLRELTTWHVPADARADAALDEAFATLGGGAPGRAEQVTVMGRAVQVPHAAGGTCRFDFEELCGQPLGAGDYLALAARYHSLVLDGVPRLSPDNYDRARRFITLIDALYDHRVKLVASAAAPPDELYQRGEGAKAFERTASRLEEMQSRTYLEQPHLV